MLEQFVSVGQLLFGSKNVYVSIVVRVKDVEYE